MANDYKTRRRVLGGIAGAAVVSQTSVARTVYGQEHALTDGQRIFVDMELADAERATPQGQVFKLIDREAGVVAVYQRTATGSNELYQEATSEALSSTEAGRGAALSRMRDGANVQQALAVASSPADLIASTQALVAGSTVRTSNGFIYTVASPGAADFHLQTAGGAKLYAVPIDGCVAAEAFGVVTGDWVTDRPEDIVDCTLPMQAAINALRSRETLMLPGGTIYTRNLIFPMGKLAVSIRGQGTFNPTTVIKFLPGANDGFRLSHEAYEFKSLQFRGSDEPGSSLFTSARADGRADMDWSFFDCYFTHADHIGKLSGRGLTVEKCVIGKINDDAFVLDFPTAGSSRPGSTDYVQSWEGGFRGFTIRGCRMHSFSNHLFRVMGTNRENARGFTITGNHSDGFARIIKGYAQEVNFSSNNWYIGWNSADASLFDLVDCREINVVGNVISNATNARQTGQEPLVRATGNVCGLNITGNTFGRRDVPVLDCGAVSDDRKIRDVVITSNVYVDCMITAPYLVRIMGAGGLVQAILIDETLSESPTGGWTAVLGDNNWRNSTIRVRTSHPDTVVHNIPNASSRDNELKTGAFEMADKPVNVFVGYQPRGVRIYTADGMLAMAKLHNDVTEEPRAITFTAAGFIFSPGAVGQSKGSNFCWEAF